MCAAAAPRTLLVEKGVAVDIAIDVLAHQRVRATQGGHNRVYECALCRAPVHFRAGSKRRAHFAHNPGVDAAACELYVDSAGALSGPAPAESSPIAPLQLCIDEDGRWQLFIEFSQVDLDEWGKAARAMFSRSSVTVAGESGAISEPRVLADLWPGAGRNVVPLAPSVTQSKLKTTGDWPNRVERRRWNRDVRPIQPTGTLFARYCGGSFRGYDPHTTPLHWGDSAILVCTTDRKPLKSLRPKRLDTRHTDAQTWHAWMITLPRHADSTVESWCTKLGARIESLGVRPQLLGAPHGYSVDDVPRYPAGVAIPLHPGTARCDVHVHERGRDHLVHELAAARPVALTTDRPAEAVIVDSAAGPYTEFHAVDVAEGNQDPAWGLSCDTFPLAPYDSISVGGGPPESLVFSTSDTRPFFDVEIEYADGSAHTLVCADSSEAQAWTATHLPQARTIRVDAGNLGVIDIEVEQPTVAEPPASAPDPEPAPAHPATLPEAASRWKNAYARATAGTDPTFVPHWRHRDRRPATVDAARPLKGAHR